MKRKFIPLFLVVVLISTHAPIALAQQLSDWSSVQQLKTNERLVVKQKNGKEVKGLMIEATDTTLTIDRDGKPHSSPRTDIRQVFVIEGKAAKGKWAAIGAGIGAGAGTGIGYTKYEPRGDDTEIYVVMGLLIGAGAGAAAGTLFG
ncbi:MAG TPA: hypothetical protein VK893_05905, partial [Pyrinomonadaceae bacterium]|nr:hypothetical protein [Pyrinomonadaceae bacterium]